MNKVKEKFIERYSRQIIIDEIGIKGQEKIANSCITIVGCGGLGTSAAQYLSMSGVGNLTLIDNDEIVLSNLNRQTLFTEKDIGKNKSKVLSEKIKELNAFVKIKNIDIKITLENIEKYLKKSVLILDCTDNFESKSLINEFCHTNKKILISAALQNFDIQALAIASWKNKENPCYKCVFPNTLDDKQNSCDDMGIISTVAGLGGIIQANFAINYILGLNTNFKQLILFDCVNLNLKKIVIKKNQKCEICNI